MNIGSKKNFAIFYKNLSELYGHMNIKQDLTSIDHKIFDIKFFGECKFYNKLKINSNSKKVLESKENSNRDLQEFALISENIVVLALLKQEIKRRNVFLRNLGNFSVFKTETEHMSIKSKINIDFFAKIGIRDFEGKFHQEKERRSMIQKEFIPIFFDKKIIKTPTRFYLHSSVKIFPFSQCISGSIKMFKKISSTIIESTGACNVKWTYLNGLLFKCPLVYFFFQFDFCKNFTSLKKINLKLQFCLFCTIFLKSILKPILSTRVVHLKKFNIGKNFLINKLECSKIKKKHFNFDFLENFSSNLKLSSSKIKKWALASFLDFMQIKFQNILVPEIINRHRKLLLKFYSIKYRKKRIFKSNLNLFNSLEKLDKIESYKKLIKYSLSKSSGKFKSISKLKQIFPSKKFFSLVKAQLLHSNFNKEEKIKVLIKLEKKKFNLEVMTQSTRFHIGLDIQVTFVCSPSIKIQLFLKIKSRLQFFRIILYNKRSENLEKELQFYPFFIDEPIRSNLNLEINWLFHAKLKKTNKLNATFISYWKSKLINRFLNKNFKNNHLAICKPFYELLFIRSSNKIRFSITEFFWILKNINIINFYFKKSVEFLVITIVFFYFEIIKSYIKFSKQFIYKLIGRKLEKRLNFFQRLNVEFIFLANFYQKK